MARLNSRYFVQLAAPVALVFLMLGWLGFLAPNVAFAGGVIGCIGVLFAAARLKSAMIEMAESAVAVEGSLQEEFVRQSRLAESYEVILDAIPDPVLVFRRDRRIIHANRAVIDLFGYDPIDSDLTTAVRNPDVIDAVEEVLAGGGGMSRTVEYTRGENVEQYLLAQLVRLSSIRQIDPAAVLVIHDLTAIRRTMEMRADFVANVSHELRTPLSTIVGMVETLQGAAKDDPAAREDFLKIMEQQGYRMTRLVEDLLSLSRIQANEHARPTAIIRISEILETAALMLEPESKKNNVTISVETMDDLPNVRGDGDQLLQVFQNLMHNAVKYGGEGSTVRVVPHIEVPQTLSVSILDQGDGIAPEHIPRLTERFYRVDKARSRAMGGTGLGLAIVKHILNRHRGQLVIDSEVGVGSTFSVTLPAIGRGHQRWGGSSS
ncbi:MAG: PAS domain-containing protein [Rhodospirillales bacterium]|jgi:two-component system, OmpR family, phosphate regulon sensor histidine kinase PhoR|nr:PAS domain-containing protein [Rhodospirillales bacterium]